MMMEIGNGTGTGEDMPVPPSFEVAVKRHDRNKNDAFMELVSKVCGRQGGVVHVCYKGRKFAYCWDECSVVERDVDDFNELEMYFTQTHTV